MRARAPVLAALLAIWLVGPSPAHGERRFALVVGSNRGLEGDGATLRYADDDSRAVRKALVDLGGFAEADVLLLVDGDAVAVLAALEKSQRQVRDAGGESLFLFFYSGHAGQDGLHPDGTVLPGETLRRQVEAIPATVRIAIVDGCHAGALSRGKGTRPMEPFLVEGASAPDVTGTAWLLSAGSAEQAQESDEYGHSLFTFWLLSALRGAADASGDGWVTLAEAWEYVRSGTALASTRTGLPQRPVWEVNLKGREDVRLTGRHARTDGPRAELRFAAYGDYWIFADNGRLVGEVHALLPGHWVALAPGDYLVRLLREGDHLLEARVSMEAGKSTTLAPEMMTSVPYPRLARKKGRANRFRHAPLGMLHYHGAILGGFGPHLGGGLGWTFILDRWWLAPRVLGGYSSLEMDGARVAMSEVETALAGGYGFDFDRVVVRPQLSMGAVVSHQAVERESGADFARTSTGGLFGAGVGITFVPLPGPAVLDIGIEGLAHLYRYEEAGGQTTWKARPAFRMILGFGYVL